MEKKLYIDNFGVDGEGVGSDDGYRLFIDGALPGELVTYRLREQKKTYAKGDVLEVLEPSPARTVPVCPVFGVCGGCQLMHLRYEEQLLMKRQKVINALQRIGKLDVEVAPCVPSPKPLHYRNKIQLPMTPEGQLGLYKRGSHEIVPIKRCYIHTELGEAVFEKLKAPPHLRHVLIRTAVNTGEVLIVFIADQKRTFPGVEALLQDPVKGVVLCVNRTLGNRILGQEFITLAGQGTIRETLCGLTFTVSPASFFQVNPLQAEHLYRYVLSSAALTGTETVLDAYCGVGTLSLLCAKEAKHVIGVECVQEAISDAKANAQGNGIANVTFVTARVEEYQVEDVDVVIVNPPRKGCEKSVLDHLIQLKPKRLIYVSCDPATLARDLAYLVAGGFLVKKAQPFDMFPQTAHVETVAVLCCG